MKLQIIDKNQGTILDKEVEFVAAKGVSGEIGILKNHIPLITKLKESTDIRYRVFEDEPMETLHLDNGLLEVCQIDETTFVKVLTETQNKNS